MRKDKLVVFSGTAHPKLGESIAKYLNLEMGKVLINRFPDYEIDIKVNSDVRGADVYVIQPTCPPVNENLMELLILVDCLRRASAESITTVIPYYGYARKDRKDEGRVPITAKLVANLLTQAGVSRIITIDLHADQVQGFFDIPVDHLLAKAVFIPYFKNLHLNNLVVVSPDIGSVKQARSYAKRLECELAIVDKRRDFTTGKVTSIALLGDVAGKTVLIVDDMISTGNTILEACKLIRTKIPKDIYICATHAVLCGEAISKLKECDAKEIILSNTIPIPIEKNISNMKIISMGTYLGETIRRIHNRESVSYLFDHPIENFFLPSSEELKT